MPHKNCGQKKKKNGPRFSKNNESFRLYLLRYYDMRPSP